MHSVARDEVRPQWALGSAHTRLDGEIGILAGRLAALLRRSLPDASGPLADGQAFLETLYAAIGEGAPVDAWESALTRRGVPPHPLDRIADALHLSPCEADLLVLAGLPEAHEGLASVLRTLHPRGEPRPTVGLGAQLLCRDAHERHLLREMLECGAAVRAGALRLGADGPFFERSLLLGDGLWSALAGLPVWPVPPLAPGLAVSLVGLEDWLAEEPARRACEALRRRAPITILVTAASEDVATDRGAAVARSAGVAFVASALTADLESIVTLHAIARGLVPVLRLAPPDGPQQQPLPLLAGLDGPAVVCARRGTVAVRGPRPVLELAVEHLAQPARRRMWQAALPELADGELALSAGYRLERTVVDGVAADVRAAAALDERSIRLEDVGASVHTRTVLSLGAGMRLCRPSAGWDRLVLPAERLAQLREAVARVAHQGCVLDEWGFLAGRPGARGVRMLLAGPPGTGKTLAAEVVAHTLGVDLLVIDLARLVSKWIGETEKHLAEVFDAAERTQAVLLFDEADALFGKRTEVRDAHDRYANLETAYLLTRLERFDGLAILSTNLRQNIDPAFTRRLEFIVNFDEPGVTERLALWRCHLPDGAPLHRDVALDQLATVYPIVGGLIRNAAVAAAFLAAADGSPITHHHLVRALRREYEKAGRAFPGQPARRAAI